MTNRMASRIWRGLAAAALVLAMAACSDGGADDTANSSATSQEPQVQQVPPEDYAIDRCLVGVWTTVSQREEAQVDGAAVVLVDVARQLSFSADGMEVVNYLDTPAAVQNPSGEPIGEVTHSGELTYQVNTDEPGRLGFRSTGGEVTATFDIGGQSSTATSDGGSAPVTYSCTTAELTQSSTGYEAVFTRAT